MAELQDQPSAQATGAGWADTPALLIKGAIHAFVLNCFIQDAVKHGRITPSTLGEEIKVDALGGALNFRGKYTTDELVAVAWNNVLMAFGTTSIATDRALGAVFGTTNPDDTSELGSARAILYQVRCAFAHDPLNPIWNPHPKYRHTYGLTVEVPCGAGRTSSRRIELNPPSLKGKQFNIDDVGGLGGYFALLHYCRTQVEAHPLGNSKYVSTKES